ncbi:ExeA family protein [Sedimenticola hydrogenitrophicus]|uniref:ExeA family protein n=1 Tax=Sedimenticola hydrogenitrophicus TaxID=2967975 RepID=UPI0021A3F253|nr:AAA family ATPase [Sedimenticola hydrogenitrophicus]
MYERHFGLNASPFSLTPDTDYYFSYSDHQEALNVLLVALRMGEGFLKITGEVGTGKTLICRKLLNTLADEGMVTAYIPNPYLTPSALRHSLAEELGVDYPLNIGGHRALQRIYGRLMALKAEGRQVVLLLDEAQALPEETLEAIRLLTNLETEKSKLLQVVLFGQPELDRHLERPSVRQLRQRITFSHAIHPLNREGCRGYVRHRTRIAGHNGDTLFSDQALEWLCRGSRGIPRLINILAHKSLLAAYGEGRPQVDKGHVRRAIADTEGVSRQRNGLMRLWQSLFNRQTPVVVRGRG